MEGSAVISNNNGKRCTKGKRILRTCLLCGKEITMMSQHWERKHAHLGEEERLEWHGAMIKRQPIVRRNTCKSLFLKKCVYCHAYCQRMDSHMEARHGVRRGTQEMRDILPLCKVFKVKGSQESESFVESATNAKTKAKQKTTVKDRDCVEAKQDKTMHKAKGASRSVHLHNDCTFNMWTHQKERFSTSWDNSSRGSEQTAADEAFMLHLLETHAKFCLWHCRDRVDDVSSESGKVEQFNCARTGTTSEKRKAVYLQIRRRKHETTAMDKRTPSEALRHRMEGERENNVKSDSLGWQSAVDSTTSDDSEEDEVILLDAGSSPQPPTEEMVDMARKGENHQRGGVSSHSKIASDARSNDHSEKHPENLELQDQTRGLMMEVKTELEDPNEGALSCQGPSDVRSSDHSEEHPENMEGQYQQIELMVKTEMEDQNEGIPWSPSLEEVNALLSSSEPTVTTRGELDVMPTMKTAQIVLKKLDSRTFADPCVCRETPTGCASPRPLLHGPADHCLVKCEVCSGYISHGEPCPERDSEVATDAAAEGKGRNRPALGEARSTGTTPALKGVCTDTKVNGTPQSMQTPHPASDRLSSSQTEGAQFPTSDRGSSKAKKKKRWTTFWCHACSNSYRMIRPSELSWHVARFIRKNPFRCRVCLRDFSSNLHELKITPWT